MHGKHQTECVASLILWRRTVCSFLEGETCLETALAIVSVQDIDSVLRTAQSLALELPIAESVKIKENYQ